MGYVCGSSVSWSCDWICCRLDYCLCCTDSQGLFYLTAPPSFSGQSGNNLTVMTSNTASGGYINTAAYPPGTQTSYPQNPYPPQQAAPPSGYPQYNYLLHHAGPPVEYSKNKDMPQQSALPAGYPQNSDRPQGSAPPADIQQPQPYTECELPT
uniref:Annexin A7-like isoform X1 n=1 Tax=Crassostrea virginica TaxID=6565 RepID=A0A8B8B1U9_CRAVI|nr:annexin A7-like isoform X1 [Crassostrea virginica]XP_022297389.1 annexin A7-like isoform X1 [Crassostrea virginica]XP_022297390.1 annexin A7-like isoform X1 [Crassostrea virginica]